MKEDKETKKESKKEEFFSEEELEKIKRNKEQSNIKWLWLVLILIIMLAGVYGSYWYFSKERIAFQKETTKEEETSETETSVPEEKKEETETTKETEESTKKVYVSGSEGLNLRSEPSTEASIVIGMPPGAELEVLEESEDGLWYKVKYDDKTGWCYKEYTSETKPES